VFGHGIDVAAYLDRIASQGPLVPTLPVLERLHRAHVEAVPFENLDVRLGRPILLDLGSLEEKLVRGRRGGYCFEQNTYFAAVLGAAGFAVETLEARVRPAGATEVLPRTHMFLRVQVPGVDGAFLADVGFGGDGPLAPVPWDGTVSEQAGDAYRVAEEDGGRLVLQRRTVTGWQDLYAFSPVPAEAIDFVVANHFTSTHPTSVFLSMLTLQRRSAAGERHVLRNRTYSVRRGENVVSRELAPAELPGLVEEIFGLAVPAAEIWRAAGVDAG
jgi:N-hydroxyarylamine O-acetyltransferase